MLDRLTKPAYSNPEGRHVAHWLYCSDGNQAGIHLTLVPNPKVIRTLVVFAEDFLTTTERRKVGL
jgi:ribosomal protein S6